MTENYFSCPKIVATFCTTILCNILMFYTNLNMLPAIFLCNYLTIIDCDQEFCHMAKHFFDYNRARPTRFRFAVSFMIAIYATLATVFLQMSSRLLCILTKFSRLLSFEQNVLNSFQKCRARSMLYVSDEIVDTATAFISFCTIIWTLYIFLSVLTRANQKNVRPNEKRRKFPYEECPCLYMPMCDLIRPRDVSNQQEKNSALTPQDQDGNLAQMTTEDLKCNSEPGSLKQFSYLDLATTEKKKTSCDKVVNLTDFIEKNCLRTAASDNNLQSAKDVPQLLLSPPVLLDEKKVCNRPPNVEISEAVERIYGKSYKVPMQTKVTVGRFLNDVCNQNGDTCCTPNVEQPTFSENLEKLNQRRTHDIENLPTDEIKKIYEKSFFENINMQNVREQMMKQMQDNTTDNLQKKRIPSFFAQSTKETAVKNEQPHNQQLQQPTEEEKTSLSTTQQLPDGFTQEYISTKEDRSKKND